MTLMEAWSLTGIASCVAVCETYCVLSLDIQKLRATLGFNSFQLAQALGVDPALVLHWESGERFATRKYCERMAALLQAHAQNNLESSSSSLSDSSSGSSPSDSEARPRRLPTQAQARRHPTQARRCPTPGSGSSSSDSGSGSSLSDSGSASSPSDSGSSEASGDTSSSCP